MGRFNDLKNNFILGEVSPKMLGRSDMKEYNQMCQEILNAIVLKQGGATRRPGTQFILKSINSVALTSMCRLIPFVFSNGEAYIMILYDPTLAITTADLSGTGLGTRSLGLAMYNVSSGVVTYNTVATDPPTANNISITNIITGRGSAGWGISLWKTQAAMDSIRFAQSGDVISMVGQGGAFGIPLLFSRIGTNTFAMATIFNARPYNYGGVAFNNVGYSSQRVPYTGSDVNITSLLSKSNVPDSSTEAWDCVPFIFPLANNAQTVAVAAVTAGTTQNATWANPNTTQFADGTIIRVDSGGTSGIGIITTGGTQISILKAFADTAAHTFKVAAWNPTYGWPTTNIFYQQRLIYAATPQQPDTLWGSQQGDYLLMMATRTLDDADFALISNDRPFQFTIAQNKISKILWMQADLDLYIGTTSDEWIARGSDNQSSLGPLNIDFAKQTSYGSEAVQAITSDGAVQFVQRGGGGLREMTYVFQQNHRLAPSLNTYAEHIVKKGLSQRASYAAPKITQLAYQALDNNITWCIDSNNCLFALTRDRAENVLAWHWHSIGGVINTSEIPKVSSIACAPSPNGDSDDLYLVVQRTINGSDVTYIERMQKPYRFTSMYNSSTDIQDKIVLADSAVLQRLGGPGNTFNGFGHLKNTVVDVLADGNYLGQITVDNSGVLTLPGPTTYTEVVAGIPYTCRIKTMPEVVGSVMGSGDSTIKRIDRVIGRFENTVAAYCGKVDDATLQSIQFRDASVANGTPTPMFTGVKKIDYGGPYENDADIIIKSATSLPFTLTSLTVRGTTYEG